MVAASRKRPRGAPLDHKGAVPPAAAGRKKKSGISLNGEANKTAQKNLQTKPTGKGGGKTGNSGAKTAIQSMDENHSAVQKGRKANEESSNEGPRVEKGNS